VFTRFHSFPTEANNSAAQKQLDYWNSVDATPNGLVARPHAPHETWSNKERTSGMLGGFEHISRIDIQGSKNFFAKLKLDRSVTPLRVADCGAGYALFLIRDHRPSI
jgi:protein N-terminal methyltransferase